MTRSVSSKPETGERQPSRTSRVTRPDVLLLGILLSIIGFVTGGLYVVSNARPAAVEDDAGDGVLVDLRRRFGPDRSSEHAEEWIVRDFFNDEPGGTFVDVGAAHATIASNTYFLESRLGWSGVAVDALVEYADTYRSTRPRTQFFTFFVGDRSDDVATIHIAGDNLLVSSATPEFTARRASESKAREEFRSKDGDAARAVATITLNDLLTRAGVARVDFISMDIELAEPMALAGFDIAKWRPRLVCIEAHPEIRQQLLDYFTARRYTVAGKYLRADVANLWFVPLDPSGRASTSRP